MIRADRGADLCIISIHTPTKGATQNSIVNINNDIFQSTLPRRERHNVVSSETIRRDFNPHSHEGSDAITLVNGLYKTNFNPHSHEGSDIIFQYIPHIVDISIHTPTKGATISHLVHILRYTISIHTPTKGATAILTNNFLIFCSISLINFILYLQIIQILFIFRYKFIFYFIF